MRTYLAEELVVVLRNQKQTAALRLGLLLQLRRQNNQYMTNNINTLSHQYMTNNIYIISSIHD